MTTTNKEVKIYCHLCHGSWVDDTTPGAHNAAGHLEECFTNPVTREPYDLPPGLKEALVHLFTVYPDMPGGLCDPMYFANVIAKRMGFGDGESNFFPILAGSEVTAINAKLRRAQDSVQDLSWEIDHPRPSQAT